MSVSYQELKRLKPASLHEASTALSAAVTKLATEHTQYKSRVVRPLLAGHAWHGGGQPDAAAVAEINGLAIDTTRLRAAAGAAAYLYACAGFTVAQVYLAALLKKIKKDQMHVDADGNVAANELPIGDDGGPGSTSAKVLTYQADMGKILRFASTIDAHSAHTLNTTHEPPVTTLTNKPGLLDKARADNTDAARDARAAVGLLKQLGEQAKDLPDLRDLDVHLPSYDVELPPGAPALAELGAQMIKAALEGAVGGALFSLLLAPETEGASTAGGLASVVICAALGAAGAAVITATGVSLSQVHIYQSSAGGISKSGGPSKNLGDLLQRAEQVEKQAEPSEPVGKVSKPAANWWKKQGIDPHAVKRELSLGRISRYDLFKDRAGNVWAIDKQGKEEPVWAGTVEDLGNG
ncbi:MAG TPA: polymorphic toxin type 33 domain-containing protein [Streptosporangiales bacterium]